MSIDTTKPLTQEEADHRHVMEHAFKGGPLDPEVARRVEERAERIQAEMRKKGPTNFTLDLLHESPVMNRLVLDASVGLKMLFVSEVGADLAVALREEFRQNIRQFIAPDLLPAEMGHALAKAERKGIIQKGDGKVLFDKFITPCPQLFEYCDLYDRSMEIASDFRVGFYDACYVALAEQESCPLVTTDEKLINSLPGFPIIHLTDL